MHSAWVLEVMKYSGWFWQEAEIKLRHAFTLSNDCVKGLEARMRIM